MFCKNCGIELKDGARFCASCGTAISVSASEATAPLYIPEPIPQEQAQATKKRKKTAGVLGIFLGAIGLHRFYLGYTGIALIQIVLFALGLLTFGITSVASFIWGIVDAIRILSGKLSKDADDNPLI